MIAPLLGLACRVGADPSELGRLVAVALEPSGEIVFLDADQGEERFRVSVAQPAESMRMAHNVQASPDGAMVWVTTMAMHGEGPDQLVGIDFEERAVSARIDLGMDVHPAHVVLAGSTAYVTATQVDRVYVVDTVAGAIDRSIELEAGTGPHGLRLLPDHSALLVAGMGTGALLRIDTTTDEASSWALPGRGVQTAVLTDGSAAFVTVYDTRQVGRLRGETLDLVDLGAESSGPIQLYPSPDGTTLWVADQGMVDGDPTGHELIALDLATSSVASRVEVGAGPHGVVVDPEGAFVWVTLLGDGEVVKVDTVTGEVVARTFVGDQPNGITFLTDGAAMP